MKKLILILSLFSIITYAQTAPPNKVVILTWDNVNKSDPTIVYRVWQTNNLANINTLATTNWTLLATIPNNTNLNTMSATFQVIAGINFFAASSSNMWGEVFSTNLMTAPYPSSAGNLKLTIN